MDKPLWPLQAPGMPPLGPDILAEAAFRGDGESLPGGKGKNRKETIGPLAEDVIRDCLYGSGQFQMPLTIKPGKRKVFQFVPGHIWGRDPDGPASGPVPADIMILGKNQGEVELDKRRCFRGKSGQHLLRTCNRLGFTGVGRWYVTNVLKTEHLEQERGSLKQWWIAAQAHLLAQELRLVRPKYLLCLGADAIKAVLGKSMTLGKMQGRVVELDIPIGLTPDDTSTHRVLVAACRHPASVLTTPELQDDFERSLNRFYQLTRNIRWDHGETDVDHRVIDNEADLLRVFAAAEDECGGEGLGKIIGLDAEWDGEHPQNDGAYLRCVQFSWAHKKAACIALRHAGGQPAFRHYVLDKQTGQRVLSRHGSLAGGRRALQLLQKFMVGKRAAGHQFCADLEWLVHEGCDLRPQYQGPDAWQDCRLQGGLDTSLMAHAANETDDFTLTGQALKYTEAPRYDLEVKRWAEEYCRKTGIEASLLPGYGDCPDNVLYPYGCYDADVTRRLAIIHSHRLDRDEFGNNCWEAYWLSIRAAIPVLEIDRTGLLLDRDRVDTLTMDYMAVKEELGSAVREWARWPDLNLESRFEVAELLFGERYNGHGRQQDGSYRRLRPNGARVIQTLPLLTTDKRPKPWTDVMREKKEDEYTASTNRQVLGMLSHTAKTLRVQRPRKSDQVPIWVTKDCSEIVNKLRDYRFISQILKGVLRVPSRTEAGEFVEDENGNLQYSRGIAGSMCSDGRVRTFISQLKETGRWASARPPLQNISKRREADYKRILGKRYRYPLRSIFRADPDYVLLEVDYKGAELYGMALMSGDQAMIEHARRNLLPEDHPNYYDIHSSVAVSAFGLPCEPTKGGLASVGKKHLRIVAKSVIFGIAYGRGAKAIALAAKEEGVEISQEEAQQVIDAIFTMYPALVPFFEKCRLRAVNLEDPQSAPRWLCSAFGRFRRFPFTDDRKTAGDLERQAQNFPIQNLVADAVSLAIANIYRYRDEHADLDFKIVLQIHDALIFLVHKSCLTRFVDEVLPICLVDQVPIIPCELDGMPIPGAQTYHLGFDAMPYTYWGVQMLPQECWELGFEPTYAGWVRSSKVAGGWQQAEEFPGKIWLERDQKLWDEKELLTQGV